MAEAAFLLSIDSARTYQRYETGENRPDAPIMERIRLATSGEVTLDAMHRLRLEWLKMNKSDAVGELIEAAE
ncbi:hypothetical protein IB279_02780 [Ensifer sp. ENS06]|uniref:hypothetical protein n=1 Tax=Ensifer sp. ENS06 TaxID=2769276 RepID=UPI00177AD07E|nr:hypothetical protein [Ensifer sp. ENS06]MBD9621864.1 hypothetical protein [Ensifer sp. ENS06]